MYIYHQGSTLIYLLIYVDDIILAGANMQAINCVITLLQNKFVVKDICDLTFFLGIEAIRDTNGLHLSQHRYILDLLTHSHMDKAKWLAFIPTPLHSRSPYPQPYGQSKVVLDSHVHLPVINKV